MVKNKFVWVNPVSRSLYTHLKLDDILRTHGFLPVECKEDMLTCVQEKYRQAVSTSTRCVIDRRCPKAADYIKERLGGAFDDPAIEPILIHCARALAAQYATQSNLLYITTPCKSLADYGNQLAISNTVFLPWNTFAEANGISHKPRVIDNSPIPPGFFSTFPQSLSLTSKQEMDAYLNLHKDLSPYKVVELLYCQNGCHNGDGMEMGWLL